jgi:hypothetical protein
VTVNKEADMVIAWFKELYQNLPRGTVEIHPKLHSGLSVSQPRSEPSTCQYNSEALQVEQIRSERLLTYGE